MRKKFTILFICIVFFVTSHSQRTQFSLATDFTAIRSFQNDQRFWTIGQTVTGHFHFTPKDGIYIFFNYSGNGEFDNQLIAGAKTVFTTPQQINYTNKASPRYRHVSIGYRHYLKGAFNIEDKWSLYGYAGFGLMFGEITNTHSISIDTADYVVPVWKGKGSFKRLTLDLSLGYEKPIGGDVFFYLEGRVLVPTTDYPSNYLFINNNAPLIGSVNLGFRVLFD